MKEMNHLKTTNSLIKKFWLNDREAILGVVLLMLVIGCLNIFSSSFIMADTHYDTPYFFLKRHGMNLAISLLALFLGAKVDYHQWRKFIVPMFAGTVVLLILVLIIGTEVNGAKRWIYVGPLPLQPAEFAKVVAIFIEAAYISSRISIGKICALNHSQLAFIFLMALLVEREPDGATAALVLGVPILMLMLSNLPTTHKLGIVIGSMLLFVLICILQPYRLERIYTLIDPWQDPSGKGYQVVQSLQAIGSGGLWGMGLGTGISKYHYLPEAHTDFAFAVWCQENGFVGACLIFILLAIFGYYGLRIANKAPDPFGQILAIGLIWLILGQAIVNLLMVSGWFPVVGIPLPFISYGGSSLLVTLFSIGVLLNIGKVQIEK